MSRGAGRPESTKLIVPVLPGISQIRRSSYLTFQKSHELQTISFEDNNSYRQLARWV